MKYTTATVGDSAIYLIYMVRLSRAPLDACRWLRVWDQPVHVRPWAQQARLWNRRKVRPETGPAEEPMCTLYAVLYLHYHSHQTRHQHLIYREAESVVWGDVLKEQKHRHVKYGTECPP